MEYCRCKEVKSVHTDIEEWGLWDVCNTCNKKIEDSYEYFNPCDAEEHIED